jgi:hypothetical protein
MNSDPKIPRKRERVRWINYDFYEEIFVGNMTGAPTYVVIPGYILYYTAIDRRKTG